MRPPPAVIDRLALLPRPATEGVRWVPDHQWHVTLRFLGSALPGDVIDAVDATPIPPVGPVRLGSKVTQQWRVIVLPADGLDAVAVALADATWGVGTNTERRPFVGHLTLARLDRVPTACPLIGHPFEAVFANTDIELIASDQTEGGRRYTTINRWPADPSRRPHR